MRWEGGSCKRAIDDRPYEIAVGAEDGGGCKRAIDDRPYNNTPLRSHADTITRRYDNTPLHWGAEQEATFGKEVRTA